MEARTVPADHDDSVAVNTPLFNDATWLADLLVHGLIRTSFVPDTDTQVLRSLLRTRKRLVRERNGHVQRLLPRTHVGPGQKETGGWKTTHIGADFGEDSLCRQVADTWYRAQETDQGSKGRKVA